MADSTADKARKARDRAAKENYASGGSSAKTDRLVMDLTRGVEKGIKKKLTSGGLGRYPNAEEQRAANIVQQRRRLDTAKTAARATAIETRTAKKKAADTVKTGISGGPSKKQAPKPAATTKKAVANMSKPTAKKPAPKAPTKTTPMPKKTTKMTPEDAAMKKLLEKKYGKIYG